MLFSQDEFSPNKFIFIKEYNDWVENYEQNQKEKYESTTKYKLIKFLGWLSRGLYELFKSVFILFTLFYSIGGWIFIVRGFYFPYNVILWAFCVGYFYYYLHIREVSKV